MHEINPVRGSEPPALEPGYLEKCGVAERLSFWSKALDLSAQPEHQKSRTA
jgi:hypothetical protein